MVCLRSDGLCRGPERDGTNHSATHLLHAALRKVLGEHDSEGITGRSRPAALRFFPFCAGDPDELEAIERLVNDQIRANNAVCRDDAEGRSR